MPREQIAVVVAAEGIAATISVFSLRRVDICPTALSSGALRYVTLVATRMLYLKPLVTSFTLQRDLDDK